MPYFCRRVKRLVPFYVRFCPPLSVQLRNIVPEDGLVPRYWHYRQSKDAFGRKRGFFRTHGGDIVDTGNTLEELYRLFEKQGVKDFRVATLFFKPDAYTKKLPVHYVGMEIENKFIVGYGLDYDGLGRNLPHIYKLKGQTE